MADETERDTEINRDDALEPSSSNDNNDHINVGENDVPVKTFKDLVSWPIQKSHTLERRKNALPAKKCC